MFINCHHLIQGLLFSIEIFLACIEFKIVPSGCVFSRSGSSFGSDPKTVKSLTEITYFCYLLGSGAPAPYVQWVWLVGSSAWNLRQFTPYCYLGLLGAIASFEEMDGAQVRRAWPRGGVCRTPTTGLRHSILLSGYGFT